MEAIAANIKKFVEERGITRDALAKAIDISRSSLYDKMSGKRPWMLADVISLATYMGCTVNDLLTMPPEQI